MIITKDSFKVGDYILDTSTDYDSSFKDEVGIVTFIGKEYIKIKWIYARSKNISSWNGNIEFHYRYDTSCNYDLKKIEGDELKYYLDKLMIEEL